MCKMSSSDRKKQLEATYKAKDTEEWLDIKFTRPAGYWWAVQCERLGLHPNTVTLISMVIGAFAGYCFYYESMAWTVLGILMLVRLEHDANAYLPMLVTLFGILMFVSAGQYLNDCSPMLVTPSGILMLVSPVQLRKA